MSFPPAPAPLVVGFSPEVASETGVALGACVRPPLARPQRAMACMVVVAALASGACSGRLAHRAEGRFAGSTRLPSEVQVLDIEVDNGSITVQPDDDPSTVSYSGTSLRAADTASDLNAMGPMMLELTARAEGARLLLRHPPLPAGIQADRAQLVVRGIVKAPSRLAVRIRTGRGSVRVDGFLGGVDVSTAAGEVVLRKCAGHAKARSEAGDVLVDGHCGTIDVEAPQGSARSYVRRLDDGGVRATGHNAVEVHLPRATGFALSAATVRGRCHNSFGLPIIIDGAGSSMQGLAGTGGPKVELRCARGPVTVGVFD